ncbi:class I SAM-dependent methyltransferase [uncultured Methanocorpusculum sp.]|nr:methyltransferase domain-containing protein [uncultured Methanocorpusculum sp.]
MIKDKIADYWNWRSTSYHQEYMSRITDEIELWEQILTPILPEGKHLNVIEVGTGPGILALALAKMGHNVTGIDLSPEMIKKAQNNAEKIGINASFREGDAENLDLAAGSADLIVSKYLMWTLPHPDIFLDGANRILAPGGRIIAVDGVWYTDTQEQAPAEKPYSAFFDECYEEVRPNLPLGKDNTPDKVVSLIADHGFSDSTWRYLDDYQSFLKTFDTNETTVTPYLVSAKKSC